MQPFYLALFLFLVPFINGLPIEAGKVARQSGKETREVSKEQIIQTNEDAPKTEDLPRAEEAKFNSEPPKEETLKKDKDAKIEEKAVSEVPEQSATIKAEPLIAAPVEAAMSEQDEISNAIYLVEQANKMQSEGRNVTIGLIEEKNINGEQVKVFSDGSQEILVRDNSLDFKVSLLCLAVVGIILFLVYTYCLY